MDMFGGAWSGGSKIGAGAAGNGGLELEEEVGKGEVAWVSEWDGMVDRKRGWVIAACWGLAVGVEYVSLPPSASFFEDLRQTVSSVLAVFSSFTTSSAVQRTFSTTRRRSRSTTSS